jgi:hypothetical protein
MVKFLCIPLLIMFTFVGCGKNSATLAIQTEDGLFIKISGLHKASDRVQGYVEIENRGPSFVKVSNKELILYCSTDSARTFMRMPGQWEIDKGLVNIMKGKSLSYQADWPLTKCATADLKATYIKFLSRESEE